MQKMKRSKVLVCGLGVQKIWRYVWAIVRYFTRVADNSKIFFLIKSYVDNGGMIVNYSTSEVVWEELHHPPKCMIRDKSLKKAL